MIETLYCEDVFSQESERGALDFTSKKCPNIIGG